MWQDKDQQYELTALANVTFDTEAEGTIDQGLQPDSGSVSIFALSKISASWSFFSLMLFTTPYTSVIIPQGSSISP